MKRRKRTKTALANKTKRKQARLRDSFNKQDKKRLTWGDLGLAGAVLNVDCRNGYTGGEEPGDGWQVRGRDSAVGIVDRCATQDNRAANEVHIKLGCHLPSEQVVVLILCLNGKLRLHTCQAGSVARTRGNTIGCAETSWGEMGDKLMCEIEKKEGGGEEEMNLGWSSHYKGCQRRASH